MKGLKLAPEVVAEAITSLKYSHFPLPTLEAIKSIMPTKEEVSVDKLASDSLCCRRPFSKVMMEM